MAQKRKNTRNITPEDFSGGNADSNPRGTGRPSGNRDFTERKSNREKPDGRRGNTGGYRGERGNDAPRFNRPKDGEGGDRVKRDYTPGTRSKSGNQGDFNKPDRFKKREDSAGSFERKRSFPKDGDSRSYGDNKKSYAPKRSYSKDGDFKKYDSRDKPYSPKRPYSKDGESKSYGDAGKSYGKKRSNTGDSDSKKYGDRSYDKPARVTRQSDGDKPHEKKSRNFSDSPGKRNSTGRSDFRGSDSSYKKRDGEGFDKRKSSGYSKTDEKRSFDKKPGDFKRDTGRFAGKDQEKRPRTRVSKTEGNSEGRKIEGEIRLNRFLANAGIASRREADMLILEGRVKVNGEVVMEMGVKVTAKDRIEYNGKQISAEKFRYVLLNKPKDFITTTDDPFDRNTVMALVENACEERIYPVGRLDRMTTGLLLFTNDGELAKKLTHPSHHIKKIYQVELNKPITKIDFDKIVAGVKLEDGIATVDELAMVGDDSQVLGLELHIGRNRIVRRIFEHLGYDVVKLDRVMFGPLTKKDLQRGNWRHLTPREVDTLKRFTA